jgi:hypothetical protein
MNTRIASLARPLSFVLIVALASACDRVVGSGVVAREDRTLDPFTSVEVVGGLAVSFRLGTQQVSLEGDDNLLPEVHTSVVGDVLRVEAFHDFLPRAGLVVSVAAPEVVALGAHAGATLDAALSGAGPLRLESAEGSELTVAGDVDSVDAVSRSGSSIDAARLRAQGVTLWAVEGSDVRLNAAEAASGAVQSGSSAWVYGDPAQRDVSADSGSSVYFP